MYAVQTCECGTTAEEAFAAKATFYCYEGGASCASCLAAASEAELAEELASELTATIQAESKTSAQVIELNAWRESAVAA